MPIKHFPVRLHAISIFLERAFNVDDEYARVLDKEYTEEEWDESGEAEEDEAFDALFNYQEIVTRTTLGELNALIEYELKWIAKSIQRKHHGTSFESEKKLRRDKACKIIEKEFHIKLKDLPGFSEVDEIRRIVNAYKHDDGYSGKYEPFFIGFAEKRYELDVEKAEQYLRAAERFLRALPGDSLDLGDDVRFKL